ncbi:NAD-dependent epimerase/dehydratase family protein [Micromonospora sp. SH-82]|uniref:NAD-dependent epimerase/dehydratase family protein n=1 Tax=Micromonospora sp. SH-82 TaxID=3132938 RepID=UPI003EBF9DE2
MEVPSMAKPSLPGNSVPSRVLVTGGAGFIGSSVVARLMLMGSHVRVVDDFSTGHIENLADAAYGGLKESDVLEGDIRTAEAVDVIHEWEPEVVVHLAAQSSVPAAQEAPLFDADVNIFGTINVLDACAHSGVKLFVYAASSAVYGMVPPEALPVREDRALAATSPYGISKAVGVCYLDWYRREHGLAFTALALGNVYGPGRVDGNPGVVSVLTETLLDGDRPTIYGDGEQTRDFVHISDVVDAVARACHHPGAGLVNIATARQTSINDLYRTVAATVGSDLAPRYETHPEGGEIRRMALDSGKALQRLGWRPTIGLAEGVQLTVRETRRRRTGAQRTYRPLTEQPVPVGR